MHPGFFGEESIRSMPEDWVFTELVMDLRSDSPKAASGCPDGITFGEYHGDIEALRNAVRLVDEDWVQYFREGDRFFCAFDKGKIAAFCSLADLGSVEGFNIGGPGCVGTVPEYRRQGIGSKLVRLATELFRREGYDLSWIHYTYLAPWYMKLGYEPVLRWNSRGFLGEV